MKRISIRINGLQFDVNSEYVGYKQLCSLAGYKAELNPTITYSGAESTKPEGILNFGDAVRVKNQTNFNVAYTDKA